MTAATGYVLETLREGAESTLYRGRQHGNILPLLAVALAAEQPSAQSLQRLEHEFSLAADLDPAWAARPLVLTRHGARAMLVFNDPGGEPLDLVLDRGHGQPLALTRCLRIAIGLTAALGQVHGCGLIHKDIKPANVLVDDEGHAWLTGFGIASRLPHESQAPAPPEVIAGTLAYMAPEQTGRMNRSIDARSDLYSVGVTLYQMLTGRLPFAAADPLEWVHCHIARQPTPPDEHAAVPGPLSAIVMKLLAKNAEERYQTAAGLGSDLRWCLEQWEAHGGIDAFEPGAHDVSDRLRIPEKLYGREREIDALLAAFDRVVADGTPELVLVSGYSGVGKSSVVNELHKVLVLPRGLFASGKFDQYQRDIPYASLAQAFQTLVRQILARSEAEVDRWRQTLTEALGPNGQLVVGLIPEVEFIIGKQPPVAELPAQDAQARFHMVFRRFIGAFARPEHPLALFLDDLQWLDLATLALLEHVVTHSEVRHLLLVGAYRNNEVGPAHPLLQMLEAIRKTGARVHEITLAPLGLEDVGRLACAALHCAPEHAQPLAQLVQEKTSGNPFFAIQFVTALAEDRLLTFDPVKRAWLWDMHRIRARSYTDNVVELMAAKLQRLSATIQEVLKQFACLGNIVDIVTLALVRGETEEATDAALLEAVQAGLVFRHEHAYRFLHDRIQQAAYSLIPDEDRAEMHLRIGRVLLAGTTPDALAEHVFEIVNQLNRGAVLVTASDEREHLAGLNLLAGRRAMASTAHASALSYLVAGAALLAEDAWEHQHELTFALELNRAECEFLTCALVEAERRLTELSTRSANPVEQASVACLRVDVYLTLDQSADAVAVGLDYLRVAGLDLPAHPGEEDARREYERVWSQVCHRSPEEIVNLPLMSDPAALATLNVLTKLSAPANFISADLVCVILCRAASLSLERGNSDGSCVAFALIAMLAAPRFGENQAVIRLAQLGYELVERRGLKRFQAETYIYAATVMQWTQHPRAGRDLLREAFTVASRSGNLTFASLSCNNLVSNLLAAGVALQDVQREAEHGLAFARNARFGMVVDIITTQLELIRCLRGLTPKFGCFDEGAFDELQFEAHFADRPALAIAECWYWIRKLQARFLADDHAAAIHAASMAQRLLWTSPLLPETAAYHYYAGLCRAALWDTAPAGERPQHLQSLAAHHAQLQAWAVNCPGNFGNGAALVGAEIARIGCRDLDAMRLYEEAIRSARANDFVHNEALANELAARFYAARGFEKIAHVYLRDARYGYLRWGATGKVRQLDALLPCLKEEERAPGSTSTIDTPVEQLDLATVIKVSQAVSGEIVLEKLIDTLMRTAIEHAGAERGLLILPRGDALRIQAEATTSGNTILVRLRDQAVTAAVLPQSVFHYVLHSHESVVLDDAAVQGPFSGDPYFREQHARSILCLPLLSQGTLLGMIYLENQLLPHVFAPARISVLKLLATQAAMSLEKTHLYRDLAGREAKIRRLVDANIIGIFIWDFDGRVLEANDAFLEMIGYDREDLLAGRIRWTELTPADWRDRDAVAVRENKRTGRLPAFEKEYFRKDGSRVPVLIGAATFEEGGSQGVSFVVDLSERKQAEAALRERESRIRRLVESNIVGVCFWNIAGGLSEANDAFLQSMGYSRQELLSGDLNWIAMTPPEYHAANARAAEELAQTGTFQPFEKEFIRKDGERVAVLLTGAAFEHSSEEGVAFILDLTERKAAEAERERLGQRLRQAEKMEAVGRFAGGIAHDFNSVLSGILAYGEMLAQETPEGSPSRRYAQNVLNAANRGRALVEKILAYSRSQGGKRTPVDIVGVLLETLELVGAALPANVRLEVSIPRAPVVAMGDATQLHQIAMNLCSNAIQAMSEGGTLRVALEAADVAAGRVLSHGTLRRGPHVCLSVDDSGSGMDEATLSRIFEPFFTTKDAGRGTGLGLSIVYAIVVDWGGVIDVKSVVKHGSTFAIYLPLLETVPKGAHHE
ncbi:AAA family ATPase [Ramlibacter sp.]|uniref:AAA family ATPase n=1 Tax=Ramlibacter sp. TaxID=1917967 RepID=UPI0026125190|nr:AAA family ATPase [Ramlibacter sp.]MDB5954115.1 protein kinase [Ramlibacter sp.]